MKKNPNPILSAARTQIQDFLDVIGMGKDVLSDHVPLANGVLELVDKLKAYQEEGKDLRPDFYIFRERDHQSLSEQIAATHLFEVVHHDTLSISSFQKALKHCAPLAHGVWAGYIKLRKDSLAYGAMHRRHSVTGKPLLSGNSKGSTPFIRIRQIEKHILELRGPNTYAELNFRVSPLDDSEMPTYIAREKLLDCLTEKTWQGNRSAVRYFLEDVLDRALLHGHGFLIAVTESTNEEKEVPPKPEFAKGLVFDPWIIPTQLKIKRLMEWQLLGHPQEVREIKEKLKNTITPEFFANQITARYAEVEAWLDLVSSMLMSDGITWLDNRGRVLGYRMFISTDKDESSGGARTRAFAALGELVRKKEIRAAFMQSQDGRARFAG